MTWRNGRQLDPVSVEGKTYQYGYDANGLRTRKTNSDGGYTEYYIVDGLTVAERRFYASGSPRYTLKYLLDEQSSPAGFSIQYPGNASNYWQSYYFGKNLQGDIIALYRSDSGSSGDYATLVATYQCDPWGNPTGIYSSSGSPISETASNVAAYNPFRYQGYHYDGDTGFYYLQSRYYDPEICRFISADSYASTGQGFLGYNMFAYCLNNPVRYIDIEAKMAMETFAIANCWNPAGWAVIAVIGIGFTILLVDEMSHCDAAYEALSISPIEEEKSHEGDESKKVTPNDPPSEEDGYTAPKGGARKVTGKNGKKVGLIDMGTFGFQHRQVAQVHMVEDIGMYKDRMEKDIPMYILGGKIRPGSGKSPIIGIINMLY